MTLFLNLSSFRVFVQAFFTKFFQDFSFSLFSFFGFFGLHSAQELNQFLGLLRSDASFGWEVNQKLYQKISMGHAVLVKRHTQSFYSFNFSIRQNFSRSSRNSVLFTIKMFNLNRNTSQGFQQTDFFNDNQISSSSLEGFMFLDSDSGINVTSNDSRLN